MDQEVGKTSARVSRELEELLRYYRPVECYRGGERIDCLEVASELLERMGLDADTTVCNRRRDVCLRIPRGSRLDMQEIRGVEVYLQVDVGDYVRPGEVLAYVITNKGELRSWRSELEGYIVLLYEDPVAKPLKCYILVAREGVSLGGDR